MNSQISVSFRYYLFLAALVCCICIVPVEAEYIAEGVKLTPLTRDGKSTAVGWAYHGDLIAFEREISDSQSQLMMIKSDGTEKKAVTPIGSPFFVEWSWNGQKLAYAFSNSEEDESQGGIFIYDVATGRSMSISAPYPRTAIDEADASFWSADDKYVAYRVQPGPEETRTRQVWVAEADSGKHWRILADRGQAKEQRWSPLGLPRLCLEVKAGGGKYDIATVDPFGRNLIQLTDVGPQSVSSEEPRWSPTGEWIAFVSDVDMTQTERDLNLEDCWIARPDGSQAHNLTKATTPNTEKQLDIDEPYWSWDGRWLLFQGDRFDIQGNEISTLYMVDPVNGGYWPILTSHPRENDILDDIDWVKWSWDSTKIAFMSERSTIRNWGPDPEELNSKWVLGIYDVRTKKIDELLVFDAQLDRKRIIGEMDRDDIENITWSPDNRSLVLTIATIVSEEDDIYKTDVYRLDLPERFIDASAPQHIGPPMGRNTALAYQPTPTSVQQQPPAGQTSVPLSQSPVSRSGMITELVKPLHMTVEEATESLAASYDKYLTLNSTRNLLVFKGPPDVLADFRRDLKLIDTLPPHILVDLLAVELTDEANRNLGLDWAYAEGHFAFFQPVTSPIQKFPHNGSGEDYRVGFPSGALDTLNAAAGIGQSFYQGVGTLPSEFFIRLNSLVSDGEAEILANPRTVAMSGKESLINIRKTLNYFFNEGFDVAGRPVVKKSDISADTEGRITARLLPDGRIHLIVDVKVGTFTFTKDAGLPELTTRQSTTEVIVRQGETVVIGGLRQQEMSRSTTKVPILGDLPLLGGLFRQEQEDIRNSVLTILITPQVMRESNPIPDWPQLKIEDHKIVPIMDNGKGTNHKKNGKSNDLDKAFDSLFDTLK